MYACVHYRQSLKTEQSFFKYSQNVFFYWRIFTSAALFTFSPQWTGSTFTTTGVHGRSRRQHDITTWVTFRVKLLACHSTHVSAHKDISEIVCWVVSDKALIQHKRENYTSETAIISEIKEMMREKKVVELYMCTHIAIKNHLKEKYKTDARTREH